MMVRSPARVCPPRCALAIHIAIPRPRPLAAAGRALPNNPSSAHSWATTIIAQQARIPTWAVRWICHASVSRNMSEVANRP